MLQRLKPFQKPVILAMCVLLPLLIYRAQSHKAPHYSLLDRAILALTAPLQSFMMRTTGFLSDRVHIVSDLNHAREENAKLRRELLVLRRERASLETVLIENQHLTALLELKEFNRDHELLTARVVAASIDPSAQTLTIDRGSLDSLRPGLPVVAAHGLVGRIQRVAWKSSQVLLLSSSQVSLPAKIVRSGARARLRGRGLRPNYSLELTEVLRSDDVKPGDQVVTSGLGGVYPPGISMGTVTGLRTKEGVPHRFADVEPTVQLDRVEFVQVVMTEAVGKALVTPEALLPQTLRPPVDAGPAYPDAEPWPPPVPDSGVHPDAEIVDAPDAGVAQP